MQIGAGDIMPIGSTLYGTCDTWPSVVNKRVTLPMFDNLIHGVTIVVKFTRGNSIVSGVQLKVADTLAYPVVGDCTCGENETISFTFEEISATNKHWLAHVSGLSDNVKNYINNAINTSTETPDVLIMKGTIGTGGNPGSIPVSGYETGWTYRVITDGTYADWACKAGDIIIAISDAAANQSTVNSSHWIVLQSKLNNAVVGPNYAVDGNIVVFDGTSGELIRDSGIQLPANPHFTDTTYLAGDGLTLDPSTNTFDVDFGNTATTVAVGNHNHDTQYAPIGNYAAGDHVHGIISNDGTVVNAANALLKIDNQGTIAVGPQLSSNEILVLSQKGTWINAILTINDRGPDPINGDFHLTAQDLGIGTSIHFIGRATVNITPGSNTDPAINNYDFRNVTPGDIVLGKDNYREYIWTVDGWELLGPEGDLKIKQTAVTAPPVATNTWVSSIEQNANGEITVSYSSLTADSPWPGNANTATSWANAQTVYVDLESYGTNSTLQGGSNTAQILKVNGILDIEHGGTGVNGTNAFGANQVIMSTNPINNELMTFTSREYLDSAVPNTISTSTKFVTEQYIYQGLPKMNNLHDYNFSNSYFAPVTAGTSRYQLLVSGTRTVNNTTVYDPEWTSAATLQSETSILADDDAYTILSLGNNINKSSTTAHSEGKIILYSANSGSHIIEGTSISSDCTHILPNMSGLFTIRNPLTGGGSATQPVYVNSDGIITPIIYVPNRLYYGVPIQGEIYSTSFSETGHYINTTQIAINSTTQPDSNVVFYVGGNSVFNGITYIVDNTDITTDTNNQSIASLMVDGGVIIKLNTNIQHDALIDGNTSIGGNLEVNGYTGLGCSAPTPSDPPSNSDFIVALGGNTEINGNLIPTLGNNDAIDKTLGSTSNPWAALFLSADYGDQYTPVYWNNTSGTPATTTPTQRIPFQFDQQHTQTLQYTSDAIKANTEVIAIVVTSGIQLLHSEIEWEIIATGSAPVLQLSATTNIGNGQLISGYVMISKTAELLLTSINSSSGGNEPGGGDTPTEPSEEPSGDEPNSEP